MKTLLMSISLFALARAPYVVRTFADASRYKDECVQRHAARGSPSLIEYMRQVVPWDLTDDDDSRWCVIRCILQRSDLVEGTSGDALRVPNIHVQMQYSNAIVEDPLDVREETNRCLREANANEAGGCLRAYTFFACIQSTEYDLF